MIQLQSIKTLFPNKISPSFSFFFTSPSIFLPWMQHQNQSKSTKNPQLFVLCFNSQGMNYEPRNHKKATRHSLTYSRNQSRLAKSNSGAEKSRKPSRKAGKEEHHLWKKRDSAKSGEKARNLVRMVCELPDEKEAVYGALDKWTAWETEFPLIAAAKALKLLAKHNQWKRVIQVAKWMLSKGQGTTMGTYDILLLAFDMDNRVDEAASLWNMILHTHTRSISKLLFSRMISLYDHHNMPNELIEIFADMEELGVRPDENTVRRVTRAFKELGKEEERRLVLKRYMNRFKYVHFNGERVRVRRKLPRQ